MTAVFYATIPFDHFFFMLVIFFIGSTLILGSGSPRPHPLTTLARWVWRQTGRRAYWWLRYHAAVALWRRQTRRDEQALPLVRRVPGASWPLGGAS